LTIFIYINILLRFLEFILIKRSIEEISDGDSLSENVGDDMQESKNIAKKNKADHMQESENEADDSQESENESQSELLSRERRMRRFKLNEDEARSGEEM
jgi:biopolymer transport protein ExbB/TolQ